MDMSDMFQVFRKELDWAGRKLVLETGKIARQADGAVLATYGDTTVLSTVVFEKKPKPGLDFFPLTVNYQEKAFAAGKIPGGFFKREGRPSEKEVLTSRLIDRPIRPLFHESYRNETQVVDHRPWRTTWRTIPTSSRWSAPRPRSPSRGIPFMGPIGARARRLPRRPVRAQPDARADRRRATLDLVVAGTKEGVLMVESEAKELTEDVDAGGRDGRPPLLPAGDRRHHPARRACRQGAAAAHRAAGSGQDRGRARSRPRCAARWPRPMPRPRSWPARPRSARSRPRPRRCSRAMRPHSPCSASSSEPRGRRRARRHPRHRQAHRRPRHQDGPPDRGRGRRAAARPRLGAVHPRRDPGAGRGHARHRPGRADHRRARGRVPRELHAALQLPSVLGRRGAAAWARPAGARSATASSPGARCARCCRTRTSSPTRSASCRRSPRATAPPRWPRSAAARWR